jgi:sugar lactone lactonase YvrE
MDADGAIWAPGWADDRSACLRVAEGGGILDTVYLEHACFACTLGEGTLYMLTADWHMAEPFDANLDRLLSTRTGRLLSHAVPTPKAGWP